MSTAATQRTGTGLEFLQRIIAGDSPGVPIGDTLGFHVSEAESGRIVLLGKPDKRSYNLIGTVHGGFAATLLDSAVGCAVHSALKPGLGYTTLELKVAYHRPMTEGTGPVRAEGKIIQVGRRAAFAEGRLTDLKGRVYATATTTCLVFER